MFARNNTPWSRTATGALLVAAIGVACTETSAPELDRVVTIEIRAVPDVDTLDLADSLTLSVWADTLTPLTVTWIVEPSADTIVSGSLVYHSPAPGTVLVRAVATFSQERVGVATRRVVTPPNGAPIGTIQPVEPNNYSRVPLGDTIAVMAAFEDPDGDSLSVRWYAGQPGSPSSLFLGSADTLRMPVDSVGLYFISVEVRDPVGARGVAWMHAEAYDPVTPALWRVFTSTLDQLSSTDGHLIVTSPLFAFDETGRLLWSLGRSGVVPVPSIGDAVYFTDDTRTLNRVSRSGAIEWSLPNATLGPVVLPDSSLVIPSTGPMRLRRISPSGTVIWDHTPDSSLTQFRPTAVGSDSSIYAFAVSDTGPLLLRLGPDGTEQWGRRAPTGSIALADDSTVLVTGDSILALRPDGSVRWSRAQATVAPVVGLGDVAYTSWRSGNTGSLLAFRTTDGTDVWQVAIDFGGTGSGEPPWPAVLAVDGAAVFSLDTLVVAVDAATGAERWRHVLGGASWHGPLLTDSGLLVMWGSAYRQGLASRGYLEALDLGTGPLDSPWPMEWGGNRRLGRTQVP